MDNIYPYMYSYMIIRNPIQAVNRDRDPGEDGVHEFLCRRHCLHGALLHLPHRLLPPEQVHRSVAS